MELPKDGCAFGLSIDSGGLRGLIPARILAEIEKRTGRHIASFFDVMGGSSTGGLITSGLLHEDKATKAPKLTANQIYKKYETAYSDIFTEFTGDLPEEISFNL